MQDFLNFFSKESAIFIWRKQKQIKIKITRGMLLQIYEKRNYWIYLHAALLYIILCNICEGANDFCLSHNS